MMIASFLSRRRRVVMLCALTVALHYLAIDWLGAHLSALSEQSPRPPETISVQLRMAPPPPAAAPSAPPPEVAPVTQPRRAPKRPAAPVSASLPPPAAPVEGGLFDPDALDDIVAAPATQAKPRPKPAEEAPPAAEPAESAAAPAPASPIRRYKVNPPPSARFDLDVKRVDADGTQWSGVASMAWLRDGAGYTLTMDVGLSLLVTRVNLLELSSAGMIDEFGLAPVTATEKRRGRSLTATHFNRNDGTITFSASQHAYPLLPGAQDKASLPFQLAGIGRFDVNQFQGDVDIFVGEDKDASVFRFNLLGEEELDTRMGRLPVWHLTRPPKPGTYSSRLDIWLAPSLDWYPLQIRNTEANGAVTTQLVTKITVTDSSGK